MIKKRNKYVFGTTFIVIISIVILSLVTVSPKKESYEEKREKLLEQLYMNIEEAKLEGNYECCIEPPCTMCYLGNWIWDDGTCHCDEMIAKGEYDKVCPQCQKGTEQVNCNSASTNDEGWCEI